MSCRPGVSLSGRLAQGVKLARDERLDHVMRAIGGGLKTVDSLNQAAAFELPLLDQLYRFGHAR